MIDQCLHSMQIRDDIDINKRDGVTSLLSCTGYLDHDITTYDAMDKSLQQVHNSTYITVKSFACYLLLREMYHHLKDKEKVNLCDKRARQTANTVISYWDRENKMFPAILGEKVISKIIPAIEGLIYPFVMGLNKELQSDYKDLILLLKEHMLSVLQPGICIDPESGVWFLSNTSETTWHSKVYIAAFICENVLDISDQTLYQKLDKGLVKAQLYGAPAVGWSDQFRHSNGTAYGGRHYPRGVTSALWWLFSDK